LVAILLDTVVVAVQLPMAILLVTVVAVVLGGQIGVKGH
jgi:hypothetical protein